MPPIGVFTLEGLVQGEMGSKNVSKPHAQAESDSKLLMFSSGSLEACNGGGLTGHCTDTSKFTAVIHERSIAFHLAVDG